MNQVSHTQRPLIGVVPSRGEERIKLSQHYLNAVWNAGGLPVILAYTTEPQKIAEYTATFDGFLFSGGVDLDPVLYGEEKQFDSVEIDPRRDAFEKALFEAVYPTGKPIFGICRGVQSVNVWLGGTLHQHMEGHRQDVPGVRHEYPTAICEGSLFHKICGKTSVGVNSFHHQAVKDVAPALVVDAVSEDGFVEALHAPDHPFLLAVQFHPEIYCGAEDDDHSHLLFRAFVDACK